MEKYELRGLTLYEPYATAIAAWGKDVENRPKPPPEVVMGRYVAIHAAWTPHPTDEREATDWIELNVSSELADHAGRMAKAKLGARGAITCVTRFIDVVKKHPSKWFCGPVGIVLADTLPLDFMLPCKAKCMMGYWRVPPHVAKELASFFKRKTGKEAPWKVHDE